MRSERNLERFQTQALSECKSEEVAEYFFTCYESCIPREFWNVSQKKVTHNQGCFDQVRVYLRRWQVALAKGYGLIMSGANGTGKTMFTCWLLTQLVKRGCSVYYTTLAQLGNDLQKGFTSRDDKERLTECLERDFVAIDEIGKETLKDDGSFLSSQFELIMKDRYDNQLPTVCCSNLSMDALEKKYGTDIASMWAGKYELVAFDEGDFRKVDQNPRMRKDMGFE